MALKKHTLNFIIFQNLLLLLSMAIMIIINCISCSLNQHWKHFVKTWVTWDTFKILSLGPYWTSLPGGSDSKATVYNAGDPGSIPGSERSPGEGNGNPLQYSCLENPMDGGAW